MAGKLFNENILEQLRHGTAKMELVSTPVSSISTLSLSLTLPTTFLSDKTSRFFARIGPSLGGGSSATKKIEQHSVQKVTGDGRCLFRALVISPYSCVGREYKENEEFDQHRLNVLFLENSEVKGMALNKGISLSPREERDDADELRMAVKEVLCDSAKDRQKYEEALVAITVDESLKRYCQRIQRPDFWGGESELLVLSRLCGQPIVVYIPEHEHRKGGRGSGFIPIAEYGSEFRKRSLKGKPRKVVRLLYSGRNHYDLLV